MIKNADIRGRFVDLVELPGGTLKFKDVVPAFTDTYYLVDDWVNHRNVFALAQDMEDDILAGLLLKAGCEAPDNRSSLCKLPFDPGNAHNFTHMLLAPPQFHSYFKGRLDTERADLFLALPIFRCEFSGDESVDLFYELRREIVPTLDWRRAPCPKAMVKFDNPKTGGGTIGTVSVPFEYADLKDEIRNLDGVTSGFIEVTSYRGDHAQLVSPAPGEFSFRLEGGKESIKGYAEILEELWRFLTEETGTDGQLYGVRVVN